MKNMKRLLAVILVIAVTLSFSISSAMAETGDKCPTKFRYFFYENSTNDQSIEISLADPTKEIKNITSSSSNLTVFLAERNKSVSSSNDETTNTFKIGVYAAKAGTYTVKYDIVNKKGTVVASKSCKVYAYPEPVSVKLGGSYYTLKGTSGKVNVSIASGNTISKIQVGRYKTVTNDNGSETVMSYKTVDNGASVKYGTVANRDKSDYSYTDSYDPANSYYNYYEYREFCPETQIKVTYKDKYTQRSETYFASFYKLPW